jgi:hypothetical protein
MRLLSFYIIMLKVTIELVPQGNEPAKRHLYSVEISNTNVDMTGNFGQYLATMVGEGIADEKPLVIKYRKFNRDQGAAKLASRILSRFFRKYKALLSTSISPTPGKLSESNDPYLLEPPAHENGKDSSALLASVQSAASGPPTPSAAVAVTPVALVPAAPALEGYPDHGLKCT